jgi:hypothetical protein
MDTPQNGDYSAKGPATYSSGVERSSEFQDVASTEAHSNPVYPSPMVYYPIQHRNRVLLTDYADFMRRTRWKAYQMARRRTKFGNFWRHYKHHHTPNGRSTSIWLQDIALRTGLSTRSHDAAMLTELSQVCKTQTRRSIMN